MSHLWIPYFLFLYFTPCYFW